MSPSVQWDWLLHPPRPGIVNMEVDRRLLERVETSPSQCTLVRFYRWERPTVSLGSHQRAERSLDQRHCLERGIPWVHRPTGGRAVFHADELTYAVVSNDPFHFPLHSLQQTHQKISLALRRGLQLLGIEATLAARSDRPSDSSPTEPQKPCFTAPCFHEVVQGSRKIVGSAQRKLKRSFLQHGAIPLTIDYPSMAAALGVDPDMLRSKALSVSEAAGKPMAFETLSSALRQGLEESFGVQLKFATLLNVFHSSNAPVSLE